MLQYKCTCIFVMHINFKDLHYVRVFSPLVSVVVKERKKRQALEMRTRELERLSKQVVEHYDSRFIELASEVGVYI